MELKKKSERIREGLYLLTGAEVDKPLSIDPKGRIVLSETINGDEEEKPERMSMYIG